MERLIRPDLAPQALAEIETPDVTVIGSGPGGTVAAIELARHGLRVLLVEAGGFEPCTDATPYFDFAGHAGAHRISYGLSMQLGGSTNLWAGRSARFERDDISTGRGWPFDLDDLNDAYGRAEKLLGIETGITAAAPMPDGWDQLLNGPLELKHFVWSRPPRNMADLLREQLPLLGGLTILLGVRCIGLIRNDGKVTGVELKVGQVRRILSPKRIVLAAGGLETARLLLHQGLDRELPALGRYLGTHPKHGVGRLHLGRLTALRSPLFADRQIDGQWRRLGIGIAATARADHLNHYVQLSPYFERLGLATLDRAREFLVDIEARRKIRSWISNVPAAAGRLAFNFFGRAGVYQGYASQVAVRGYFDQRPDRSNGLRLVDQRDPDGLARAEVVWSLSDEDFASISGFLAMLSRQLSVAGIGRLVSTLPDSVAEWKLTGIHSHFMGTTRMGSDVRDSVTDGWGRVHGQEKLFVSGPGLFRTYSYANPVLTICALALRVAQGVRISLHEKSK